jgi:predicted outer membrane protein
VAAFYFLPANARCAAKHGDKLCHGPLSFAYVYTHTYTSQESEMQKNKALKGLLAVSAVAAMFSAFGVQAQTSVGSSPSQTGTSSTNPNMAGKTTKEGTIDNTNSTGMENRGTQAGASGMSGSTGATSGQGKDQSTGSSSSAGAAGMTGKSATEAGAGMQSSGASAAGQTAAGAATGAKLSAADQKILKDMAMANMAEIEGGKLAQSKGQSSEVKAFGQQMIDDHGANLKEVQALAQARGVTLPTEPDAKHKAMAAKLDKMSGDAFDKAYMAQAGVQDHKTVHAKLAAASKKAKDPEVKALVDKTEPVVAQHLKSAQQMPMAKSGTAAGK